MPRSKGNGVQLIRVLRGMSVRQRLLFLIRYAKAWGAYWKRMARYGLVPPHLQYLDKIQQQVRKRREHTLERWMRGGKDASTE